MSGKASYPIAAPEKTILKDVKSSAYDIAQSGGRNNGLYRRFKDARTAEIEKSIRSLEKRISLHEDKIRNPQCYLKPDLSHHHRADLIERYWPEEIADFKEQIIVLRGILEERNGESR
ncbi:hypothetical protein SAMN05421644_11041 [Allochromatium warmingii]|uniref:Uncharacterized protein n=1 Tax=Allochromatium warmingii TaxID=61595 RepID=A0A1H3DX50_ALLWA|nr:hypothetical protein [Allochromatium warmingii]SDX70698.1 hypothetical protein SAMN05421644_11041 [Allochromatium warmingii]